MLRLFSERKIQQILQRLDGSIHQIAATYSLPPAVLQAVIHKEMSMMNLPDLLADFLVWTNLFPKKDSSTGYSQIFGSVGIAAVNEAVDQGLCSYESLRIPVTHRLDATNPKDLRTFWRFLRKDRYANLEVATLNLLSCAKEKVGHTHFGSMSPEELQLVFTRYNANVNHITSYGASAYQLYQHYTTA